MLKLIPLATAALLATTLLAPLFADAATSRQTNRNATSACQPATPLQLGGLRFRPAGIYNNKPDPIYISCSLETEAVANEESYLTVSFRNKGTKAQVVECVAASGSSTSGFSTVASQINLAPGEGGTLFFFDMDRGTILQYTTINLSCLLPANMEMGTLHLTEWSDGDYL